MTSILYYTLEEGEMEPNRKWFEYKLEIQKKQKKDLIWVKLVQAKPIWSEQGNERISNPTKAEDEVRKKRKKRGGAEQRYIWSDQIGEE